VRVVHEIEIVLGDLDRCEGWLIWANIRFIVIQTMSDATLTMQSRLLYGKLCDLIARYSFVITRSIFSSCLACRVFRKSGLRFVYREGGRQCTMRNVRAPGDKYTRKSNLADNQSSADRNGVTTS
jgi:hypothetical protein